MEKQSWHFHRSAFRVLGRPLPFGEYGHLRRQIDAGLAELLRFGGKEAIYRTRLRDGSVLEIIARHVKAKKPWHNPICAMMKPSRQPRQVIAPELALHPATAEPAPPVTIEPPPVPTPRANVLILGTRSSTAADIFAHRLQPKATPPRLHSEATTRPAAVGKTQSSRHGRASARRA